MKRRTWSERLPVVTLVLLLLVLLMLAGRGPSRDAPDPGVTPEGGTGLGPLVEEQPEFRPPPRSDFAIVVTRNLFSISRTAPPEAPAGNGPAAGSQELSLVGILLAGGKAVALLRDRAGNRTVQLAQGEAYGGWTLERLDAAHAVLRRGSESMTLGIVFADATGSGVPGSIRGPRRRQPFAPRRGDAAGNPVPAERPSLFEIQRGQPANAGHAPDGGGQ
ncbi:MAG: hypothetical protein ACE5ED_09205 [Rhodothalassiaceae bacterium]